MQYSFVLIEMKQRDGNAKKRWNNDDTTMNQASAVASATASTAAADLAPQAGADAVWPRVALDRSHGLVDQIVAPVPGGIGRYTEELTKELIRTAPPGCSRGSRRGSTSRATR